ncbi:MAG: family 43 glycosylhydrolase [Abitibacteriaceae bacterium]|nr:family 43 glycosylhydrolase [Abditibacteriaceae bacterium]
MNPVQNTTQSVSSVNSVSSETTSSDTTAGWKKYAHNPVLGGALGTCFDISVLKDGRTFRMWFSWRPRKSIALVESQDGFHWSEPVIALGPNPHNNWESDLNRPSVIKVGKTYHMWYTGQTADKSWIGHAISTDGKTWQRLSDKPELSAAQPWEKTSVMCPDVMWDKTKKLFRMWYSGGEQYEPNAIGYATSRDGIHWTKLASNPIFLADPNTAWEQHKVTACHVVQQGKWYVMFYIGFHTEDYAQIGIARSRDGVTNWQRHPANPIIRPTPNGWDASATYKPFVIWDGKRWMLWYNGRHDSFEQIGVATHEGKDLGFEKFDARVGK